MIGTQPDGAITGAVISAVAHEGPTVTINGQRARFAIVTDDNQVFAAGDLVAREFEAAVINSYRNLWIGQGHLRVLRKPIEGPCPD